jgi:hypothetical protein
MLRSREALAKLSVDRYPWARSVSGPWILALVASKAGDLATTIAGLTVVDGLTERNPIAGAIFEQFGVVGLGALSAAVLVVVVAVIEYAATVLERQDETSMGRTSAYLLGYLPMVVVFGAVTLYNAVLLCIRLGV